ncbi:hypothetical protein [Dendronalium phyllosphericum]|nr:hypothetical protein [Dendronalium phyllosphericum]
MQKRWLRQRQGRTRNRGGTRSHHIQILCQKYHINHVWIKF